MRKRERERERERERILRTVTDSDFGEVERYDTQ